MTSLYRRLRARGGVWVAITQRRVKNALCTAFANSYEEEKDKHGDSKAVSPETAQKRSSFSFRN